MPAHRRSSLAAGALALIALAPATAGARPAVDAPAHARPRASAAAHQAVTERGGLEWGSTALGAGGATIVFVLAGAGVLGAQRRHPARPARP